VAFVEQQLVQAEEYCSAVDAPGERNADRRCGVMSGEPPTQLAINSLDVTAPDEIQILVQRATRRVEKALVHRIGVRTSDQSQSRHVMRGRHTRITRVELINPSTAPQLGRDLVHALRHDQHWSVGRLREKISHRTVETSRQHDAFPILRYEGKGAVDPEYSLGVAGQQPASRFRSVNRPESLGLFWNQVDNAGNWQLLVHTRKYLPRRTAAIMPASLTTARREPR